MLMHRIISVTLGAGLWLSAADPVVIDGAGVMTVTGTVPATAATAAEVKVGGGTVKIGGTAANALAVTAMALR